MRTSHHNLGKVPMKPVVKFVNLLSSLRIGHSALLRGVVGHPAGLRGDVVMTSSVVKIIDPEKSFFETENTIYQQYGPEEPIEGPNDAKVQSST